MPKFQYKAKNMAGRIIEGVYEAPSQQAVVEMVRQKSFYLLEIKEIIERKDIKEMDLFSKITIKDITIFCKQFAAILRAGVPLIQALHMLTNQTENKLLQNIIHKISEDIQKGSSLSMAMSAHGKKIPPILIHMIHAGEVSGTLENSLEVMSEHFEKAHKLRQKVKSAMIYPILVCVVAVIVVIFLLTFVVPTFIKLFESSGTELPFITRMLIAMSGFLKNNFLIILLFTVLLVGGIKFYLSSEKGRLSFDQAKFRMPLFGELQTKSIAANFSRTMSTLMSTGVGITEALNITSQVLENTYARKIMGKIEMQVKEGKGLYVPVRESKLFPVMMENMIMLGEESGTLENMLSKTADFFEDEVDEATKRLTTMLEPMIIMVLGIVVAFIVIGIALPMFDLSKTVA
jgi:type IV pilus assembly protein PilC